MIGVRLRYRLPRICVSDILRFTMINLSSLDVEPLIQLLVWVMQNLPFISRLKQCCI